MVDEDENVKLTYETGVNNINMQNIKELLQVTTR